jgi:hypothetical protein
MITILANHAHQDRSRIEILRTDVSQLLAMDKDKFNSHLILNHVEDARPAHGQDKSQTDSSKHALTDH